MSSTQLSSVDCTHGSGASISACGRYRYWLMRRWADGPHALFVMLNPSTADASEDDPTIRRCVGFAKTLGYGGVEVVNLFAWRATDPDAMFEHWRRGGDIIGPECDIGILRAVERSGIVIAAWGADKRAEDRARYVLALVSRFSDVYCLAKSNKGAPRHPLYLPASARPEVYRSKVTKNATQMPCVVPVPKAIELKIGQRWQFFTERCDRVEVSVWAISAPWPDGARRVHLREPNGISWESLDTQMLNDPTWTLLSSPRGDR